MILHYLIQHLPCLNFYSYFELLKIELELTTKRNYLLYN